MTADNDEVELTPYDLDLVIREAQRVLDEAA